MARWHLPLVAAALCLCAACGDPEPISFRLMTWNLGNPSDDDPDVPHRLTEQAYEDFVRDRIRVQAPDLVLLQELLSPDACPGDAAPGHACHAADRRPPQVRRLLGTDYTIVCDANRHLECVGVRTSLGAVAGVPLGGFEGSGAETARLPLAGCHPLEACNDERCEEESSVSALTLRTAAGPLRVVHVHLMAPGRSESGLFWGSPCRARQLAQVFGGTDDHTALVGDGASLVVGDFNLDPERLIGDAERTIWERNVGTDRRFRDLTPRSPSGTQYGTRRGSFGTAIDHVLSDRATGACTVHGHGIGPDPGTEPLDQGFEGRKRPAGTSDRERIDHFAITCALSLDLRGDPEDARANALE